MGRRSPSCHACSRGNSKINQLKTSLDLRSHPHPSLPFNALHNIGTLPFPSHVTTLDKSPPSINTPSKQPKVHTNALSLTPLFSDKPHPSHYSGVIQPPRPAHRSTPATQVPDSSSCGGPRCFLAVVNETAGKTRSNSREKFSTHQAQGQGSKDRSMADAVIIGNQHGQNERSSNLSFQCPILTSTNYPIWSLRIKAILKAHGIWDVIEPGTNLDQKKDNAVIAYLYQSLPEDLILQVASCEHAKDIWSSIKTRHLGVERVMEARLQSLRTEFDTLRMIDGETVDDYVAKLSGIASKSATLGSIIDEQALVRKLLTSMPKGFLNMVATIEQLVDLRTVRFQEVVGRLKAYEERSCLKQKTSNSGQNQLLLSYEDWEAKKRAERGNGRGRGATSSDRGRGRGRGRGRSGGRGRGTGRGQATTSGTQGSSNYRKDRSQLQCFRCDALGNFSADCPTRRQEEVNQTQANADRPALLMTVAVHTQKELIYLTEDKVYPANHTSSQDEQSMWYLDNGASNHMTGNKGLFSKLDTKIGGNVRFGDGSCVDIEGRGSILLECKNGEHRLLTDVYYIPFLKSNIISLGQLTEGGCKILMKQYYLWLYESDERLLMKVHRSANRLYKINLKIGAPVCLQSKVEDSAWIWHARLGHVNFDTIKRISTKEMVL
ncbi:hypothetical protein E3N88_12195 [Mikania micrantha]|uniref:CCHC-type domain-containing protein n=1 Tax=Mikania micrantha TaxID=192012 RepID=A0A5N6P7D8_9ASTR|nr:hypothetical protein E3N88_12195 [Mikania micrantha]